MSVAARVSMILSVQEHVGGAFPRVQTYPSAYERRVDGESVKVFAATGAVASGGTTLDVPGTLATVHYWMVENLADPGETGTADVTVTGGPVNVTLHRGQVLFVSNETAGWTAEAVTITGTAATPYKVIALGE